ncbi:hypothetical protein, partial [Marinitenerispora sediminis]|uniref:hypothetical protein n=1 Tax=Marinitenerispora sediminis TaxID=1931232 RepID=UPI001C69C092
MNGSVVDRGPRAVPDRCRPVLFPQVDGAFDGGAVPVGGQGPPRPAPAVPALETRWDHAEVFAGGGVDTQPLGDAAPGAV